MTDVTKMVSHQLMDEQTSLEVFSSVPEDESYSLEYLF